MSREYSHTLSSSQLNDLDIFVYEWYASFPIVSVNSLSFLCWPLLYYNCLDSFSSHYYFYTIFIIGHQTRVCKLKICSSSLVQRQYFCLPPSVQLEYGGLRVQRQGRDCGRHLWFLKAPQMILMNRQNTEALEPTAASFIPLDNPHAALSLPLPPVPKWAVTH